MSRTRNVDENVVKDFGLEWKHYNQGPLDKAELGAIWNSYFSIFPWDSISENAEGFDLGCGSGRWASLVAPRVGRLHCIDPSVDALNSSKKMLSQQVNCSFHQSSVSDIPLPNNSMDFGYSLGVLHHVPDTQDGVSSCVRKLKSGAPFLLYLCYSLDNKPRWFYKLWKFTDFFRRFISKLPFSLKLVLTYIISILVYFPLSRVSYVLEKHGVNVSNIPLSTYKDKSLYTMRTDALDRFGTKLEKRFSKSEILKMMKNSGLVNMKISKSAPYWCVVGYKS